MPDIGGLLSSFAQWVWQFISNLPLRIFQGLLDALAGVINALPVPSFFAQASGAFAGLSSGVVCFITPFELGYGLSVVLGAYSLRWILRRIPFIGG